MSLQGTQGVPCGAPDELRGRNDRPTVSGEALAADTQACSPSKVLGQERRDLPQDGSAEDQGGEAWEAAAGRGPTSQTSRASSADEGQSQAVQGATCTGRSWAGARA